ncbi:MAG: MFS transporter [Burkholderiales bacterium]|nr:MFS transporter [Burkholderiales bacterium]
MIAQVGTLILATSLIQLANGFFTTWLALRLSIESFDPALEGVVMSAYFVGFTIGSLTCGRLIQRIGHIRGYAAFGGIAVAATAAMALFVDLSAWVLLRTIIGFGCVGLFVTTESWLNAKAPVTARGRVFSMYMLGTFLALAFGQLLIGRLPIAGSSALNVIVALFAVALAIVSATRAEAPAIVTEARLPYRDLVRCAPLAVLGCAVAGMLSATYYAVLPAWMMTSEIPQSVISLLMLSTVLGGLAFQVPVGWLSDRLDRRVLLGALAAGFAIVAAVLPSLPKSLAVILFPAAVLGGFMSTLYPVCVSHAMDNMASARTVSISGRLILISGIGSAIGPVAGSWIMLRLDINGLLYFMSSAAALLGVVALSRAFTRPEAEHAMRPFTVVAPQAVHVAPPSTEAEPQAAR